MNTKTSSKYEEYVCRMHRTSMYISGCVGCQTYKKMANREYRLAYKMQQYRNIMSDTVKKVALNIYSNNRVRSANSKIKRIVFAHYGNKCNCCGEDMLKFLAIDHVNNDGYKDLMPSGKRRTGRNLWSKIKRDNFPKIYQLLCSNCNWGKRVNGGVCPHINMSTETLSQY